MTIETGYQCKECGSPAVIQDGKVVRSCLHTGTVIAMMDVMVSAGNLTSVGSNGQSPSPTVG